MPTKRQQCHISTTVRYKCSRALARRGALKALKSLQKSAYNFYSCIPLSSQRRTRGKSEWVFTWPPHTTHLHNLFLPQTFKFRLHVHTKFEPLSSLYFRKTRSIKYATKQRFPYFQQVKFNRENLMANITRPFSQLRHSSGSFHTIKLPTQYVLTCTQPVANSYLNYTSQIGRRSNRPLPYPFLSPSLHTVGRDNKRTDPLVHTNLIRHSQITETPSHLKTRHCGGTPAGDFSASPVASRASKDDPISHAFYDREKNRRRFSVRNKSRVSVCLWVVGGRYGSACLPELTNPLLRRVFLSFSSWSRGHGRCAGVDGVHVPITKI